jgi:hypothetical protein
VALTSDASGNVYITDGIAGDEIELDNMQDDFSA